MIKGIEHRSIAALALFACLCPAALAQTVTLPPQSIITTFAGNGLNSDNGDGFMATNFIVSLNGVHGVAVDATGAVYLAEFGGSVVRKIDGNGIISTIAGSLNLGPGFSGDNGPATDAQLNQAAAVAVDRYGNVYIADQGNNRVRVVYRAGTVTGLAGPLTAGYIYTLASAQIGTPQALTFDSTGNLYIADISHQIIWVLYAAGTLPGLNGLAPGSIYGLAGSGTPGNTGDGGLALAAKFESISDLKVDGAGNVYISDSQDQRVRVIYSGGTVAGLTNPTPGFIYNFAGTSGTAGFSGDNGPAQNAQLSNPQGLAIDSQGDVYIADSGNNRIREVSAGVIATVTGDGTANYSGDGAAPLGPLAAQISGPAGLALDAMGQLYISDLGNNVIRRITPNVTVFAGTETNRPSVAQNLILTLPSSTTLSLSVPDSLGGSIEFSIGSVTGCTADGATINPGGSICTFPIWFRPAFPGLRQQPLVVALSGATYQFGLQGVGGGALVVAVPGMMNTQAEPPILNSPHGFALDATGTAWVANTGTNSVVSVPLLAIPSTVAGTGTAGYSGDNGPATAAQLNAPQGTALDSAGNLYIADTGNNVVRQVSPAGTITTWIGPAQGLNAPQGLAFDSSGNAYIADTGNNRVMVRSIAGTLSLFAGTGAAGYLGDNGPASAAELNGPQSVAVDNNGNVYIADTLNHVVRRVDALSGFITTVAGTGSAAYGGDGGAATAAQLNMPGSVSLDAAADLLIADTGNNRVRKVDAATGLISTVAGNGTAGWAGDGGAATLALIASPAFAASAGDGTLYISDPANSALRTVSPGSGSSEDSLGSAPTLYFPITPLGSTSPTETAGVADAGNENIGLQVMQPIFASPFSLVAAFPYCPSPLPAGSSCQIPFQFTPTSSGESQGSEVLRIFDRFFSIPLDGETAGAALNIFPASLQYQATYQQPYLAPDGQTIAAGGGIGPVLVVPSGTIPGMYFLGGGRVIELTGTPTQCGNFNFSVSATDAVGDTATQNYTLMVTGCPAGPAIVNISETIHVTDSVSVSLSAMVVIGETVHVVDSPVLLPSAMVTFGETVHVKDSPGLALSAMVNIGETVHVTDSVSLPIMAIVNLTETVHVVDTPSFVRSAMVNVGETVHVSDSPGLALSAMVNIGEAVHVRDSVSLPIMAIVNLAETVHVADTPSFVRSAMVNVGETVHVVDTPSFVRSAMVNVGEIVHVADSPALRLAAMVSVGETVHVHDSPGVTIVSNGTSTALSAQPTAPYFGETVVYTATVTAAGNGTAPTGTVTFKDGSLTLGTGTLSGGTATLTTSATPEGTTSVIATYGGDLSHSGSTSPTLSITVSPAATSTALSAQPTAPYFGESVVYTAAVTAAGNGTAPTGSVTFKDGAITLGTGTLSGGTATLTTSITPEGSTSVIATYGGDSSHSGSTSPGLSITVSPAATSTALSAQPTAPYFGESVVYTAAVTAAGNGTAPTGSVTFKDGAITLGTGTLSGGTATLTTSATPEGTTSVIATYGGDSAHSGSTSPAVSMTVKVAPTTVSLMSSVTGAAPYGQPVTFTATVAPPEAGTPTGIVTFKDGVTTLGTGQLGANREASITTTLAPGAHSITAVYGGDADFASSTSPALPQSWLFLVPQFSMVSRANPSVVGQVVTFAVTATGSGPTVTGTVTFLVDGASRTTAVLDAGSASADLSFTVAAQHTIGLQYSGDANYGQPNFAGFTQTVNKAATSVALTPSANPALSGAAVIFTAAVAVNAPGQGVPGGTVTFSIDNTPLTPVPLSAGAASYTTSTLSTGPHSITAAYSGNLNFAASTSSALSETILSTGTAVTLTSSANPANPGQAVTLAATVTASGGIQPQGTLTFFDGVTSLGAQTVSNGKASIVTSALGGGQHSITAQYSSTNGLNGSTSAVLTQKVLVAITVTASPLTATLEVDGNTFTGSQTFNWLPGDQHALNEPTPQTPSTGIVLDAAGWSNTVTVSQTITVPGAATTYTGLFTTAYVVQANINPANAGTVTGAGLFDAGSTVVLQASANAGFVFASFSGSEQSTNPVISFHVTAPTTVTANFTPLEPALAAATVSSSNGTTAGILNMVLSLTDTGQGVANNAQITSVDSISVLSGTGTVTLASGVPGPSPGATLQPGGSAQTTLVFNWPTTATRVSFRLRLSATDAAGTPYTTTQVVSSFR